MHSSSNPSLGQRPGEVTAIAITALISGITNILAGITWTLLIVFGTLGVGIVCVPVTILPGVLGIAEIVYATKMLSSTPDTQPSQAIAILEICGILFLNIFSLVAGIIGLVFSNDAKVKEYFGQMAGGPVDK